MHCNALDLSLTQVYAVNGMDIINLAVSLNLIFPGHT